MSENVLPNPLPTKVNNFALSAFGDNRNTELHPQIQGSFEYTVDNTDLTTNTVVNGATVTQDEAMAIIASSTTTASTALLQSKRHAKYKSGLGGVARFTALFTAPVAGTEQYSGLMDEVGSNVSFKNGYMIGYIGTTFGFSVFKNDTVNTVPQSLWDDPLDGAGDSAMTLDQTKLNVWFIQFQYLGAGAITLWVEDASTGEMIKVHTILYANLNITPSTFNPNFHFSLWVDNKDTTSNIILKSSSYAYFIEGKTSLVELHQPQTNSGQQSKSSVTTELAIFTVRNKAAYASKTNFIDVLLETMTASIEASNANNLGNVRLVRNATLGGAPSFADINTSDSVLDIDVDGTTVTDGKEIFNLPLAGKNDRVFLDLTPFKIILAPGETLTLSGVSANSATINGSVLIKELF